MRQRYGTALVTGATSGIGEAFARQLPDETDLLLTGRDADRLAALERALARPGRRVQSLAADLAAAEGRQAVVDWSAKAGIDLLVNNAGFGLFGAFRDNDAKAESAMVQVNVLAVVELTRSLLQGMLARAEAAERRAGLIVVSSNLAFMPFPYMATYAASKAFELSFTEAIAEELRDAPIDVMALCPGATRTAFADRSGMPARLFAAAPSAEHVARKALNALGRQTVCNVGAMQTVALAGPSLLQRAMAFGVARTMERWRRPG